MPSLVAMKLLCTVSRCVMSIILGPLPNGTCLSAVVTIASRCFAITTVVSVAAHRLTQRLPAVLGVSVPRYIMPEVQSRMVRIRMTSCVRLQSASSRRIAGVNSRRWSLPTSKASAG